MAGAPRKGTAPVHRHRVNHSWLRSWLRSAKARVEPKATESERLANSAWTTLGEEPSTSKVDWAAANASRRVGRVIKETSRPTSTPDSSTGRIRGHSSSGPSGRVHRHEACLMARSAARGEEPLTKISGPLPKTNGICNLPFSTWKYFP